jgi:CHAT domain-containing protein
MTRIGTALCLIALASTGGGLSSSTREVLTERYRDASSKRKRGEYQAAADLFLAGAGQARLRNEPGLEARFLWGLGNCHFAQRRYQEALGEYLQSRDRFERLGEHGFVRALNGNIGSLYSQLGELDAAVDAMKQAVDDDPALEFTATRINRLVTFATLLSESGKPEQAARTLREVIVAADRIDDPELLSNAWDRLGSLLLTRNELPEAEDALLEAYRIRKLGRLSSLAGSYGKLGLLRLEQGDMRSASALLDAAVAESQSSGVRIPEWRFYHARGRLRLAEGKLAQAYVDFRLALELARNYRLAAPSSDATRVSLEGQLQPVYASFVETGARLYLETGRPELARETFEALEENRGGSLAARLTEMPRLRRAMPPAYWDALAALQSAESAALLDDSEARREDMRRLRGQVVEIEARASGSAIPRRADLLARLQRRLDGDTALLSFHLGRDSSRLWAVSASGLSLYPLAGKSEVVNAVHRFRTAILTRDPSRDRLGRELYAALFGRLGPAYQSKTRWLLSLDDGLFETPFAALATPSGYLVERHSLRIVTGAANLLDTAEPNRLAGSFAGIGDAVYNTADPRWQGGGTAAPALGLSRLPGTGPEIEASAREWRSGSVLLQGADVSRANVRRAVEGGASVVHVAAHILQDSKRSTGAMISLGLSRSGADELLGAPEIGGWKVAAGVVVLSGCSSGSASARPGAGLMGLTRAWLMAGAGAVVATGWSMPDDASDFFRAFYRELQRRNAGDPADALRAAQLEALRSPGWRSDPEYWAAYFILGNR